MARRKKDETSILQIQLGASQLEIKGRGEDNYKRRKGARERQSEKLGRKSLGKNKREKEKRRERVLRVFSLTYLMYLGNFT